MGRIVKATDSLSAQAKQVMARGFAASLPAARIAQMILDATGEQVATRTIGRRAQEFRAAAERRRNAREHMEDLVGAMKAGGLEASEMIQALAMDRLIENPELLTGADPVKVQSLSLASEDLRLKRKAIEVRERSVAVAESRLRLLEERDRRARAAVEAAAEKAARGETLSPDDIQRIRDIYGLKGEAA